VNSNRIKAIRHRKPHAVHATKNILTEVQPSATTTCKCSTNSVACSVCVLEGRTECSIYLFFYGLFNEPVSSADCIVGVAAVLPMLIFSS
jgi:hypothetical protein